jgi:hypothetical protein
MTRRLALVLSALLATLLLATPASAGNWATAELAAGPEPAAGVEQTYRFLIKQHGVTPVSWVTATFVATNLTTGEQVQFPMRAVDANGNFMTQVTFPEAGDWTWFVMLAELGTDQEGAGGTLTVLEPTVLAAKRLSDLRDRFGGALLLVPGLEGWLDDLAARAGAG